MKFFKGNTQKEKLKKRYRKVLEEAYRLSHTNRKASDLKMAEAEEIMRKIESLGE